MCPDFVKRKVRGWMIFFFEEIMSLVPFEAQQQFCSSQHAGEVILQFRTLYSQGLFPSHLLSTGGSQSIRVSEEDLKSGLKGVKDTQLKIIWKDNTAALKNKMIRLPWALTLSIFLYECHTRTLTIEMHL